MIKLRPSMELARRILKPPVTGVEIGVLGGSHACGIIENWEGLARLHLVDSYGGISENSKSFRDFEKKFESISDKICWHIMTSVEAEKNFGMEILHFAYIDADHRYFRVKQDMCAWWPKIRVGGILCGHDYFTHGSVKKAVDDWAKENGVKLESANPDWWIIKTGENKKVRPKCDKCITKEICELSANISKSEWQQMCILLDNINRKLKDK